FDELIKNCRVIELEGPSTLENLFSVEADYLSEELKIDSKELVEKFKDREKESTTAFTTFTAIPHVVIPSVDNFKMVVVRCKSGIYFSEQNPSIKAVFLFISGGNLAYIHLQTLAAVAAVTCESNFEEEWLAANSSEHLKDIILFAQRKRFNN
ncbi:MAG: PTS sugar transporter subunit IIA, partial [Lentisphaeria bacterium]